ncbi:DMT family transporter [Natronospirillum operosum]|uniref:DMT family transporter n=1 Tax=Natronospirillum operosum TaxID=2759953 RepID=A0A4Z0WAK5_9GAMM|nr:DMT family transporter [Natronospirillum operosum]TGG94219.1 DMT family transporter [Natronospirillum operosum]
MPTLPTRTPLDWILLLYLSLAWGLAFMLIALALPSFPPLTLVAVRLTLGALTLCIIMYSMGLRLPVERAWWARFATLALLGNVVPFSLISWGELYISSSLAGILMALMPINVMILAHFFIASEPMSPRKVVGFVMGFVGVLVLVGTEALSNLGGDAFWAQMAIIAATVFYSVTSIYTKRLPRLSVLVAGAGTLVAGSLLLWPVALVVDRPWTLEVTWGPLVAVVILGVFSSGLANWVYFTIVQRQGPSFLSMINYIIPVIAFAAGVGFLSEAASADRYIALVMILLGIAISQRRRTTAGI